MGLIDDRFDKNVFTTSLDFLFNWGRRSSLWWLQFGLACCAIEMISYGGPRQDAARWGHEVFRASPRQADLMIVSGRVSQKMAPVVRQLYDQMPNPKWVISMGACASSGGIFNNYAIIQGCDHIVPVDVYLPGCPPSPDMLIDAVFKIREQIQHWPLLGHMAEVEKTKEKNALEAPATIEMKGLMR